MFRRSLLSQAEARSEDEKMLKNSPHAVVVDQTHHPSSPGDLVINIDVSTSIQGDIASSSTLLQEEDADSEIQVAEKEPRVTVKLKQHGRQPKAMQNFELEVSVSF